MSDLSHPRAATLVEPSAAPVRRWPVAVESGWDERADSEVPDAGRPRYDLDVVVAGLRASREVSHNIRRGGRVRPPPSLRILGEIVDDLTAALFPSHHGPGDIGILDFDHFVRGTLNGALCLLEEQIRRAARFAPGSPSEDALEAEALNVTRAFSAALPALRGLVVADLHAAHAAHPAAGGLAETLLSEAGVSASIAHRFAHVLDGLGAALPASLIAAMAERRTGIAISPSAAIGPGLAIGRGSTIGSGVVVGGNVRLGGGVTLGAAMGTASGHPTVGDDVTIHAGATVVGAVTIGRGAVVGGGVWLTESLPPGGCVLAAPLRRLGVVS